MNEPVVWQRTVARSPSTSQSSTCSSWRCSNAADRLAYVARTASAPATDAAAFGMTTASAVKASMTASRSRESVNRALAALVTAGDIRRDDGHIVLVRPDALRRLLSGS